MNNNEPQPERTAKQQAADKAIVAEFEEAFSQRLTDYAKKALDDHYANKALGE